MKVLSLWCNNTARHWVVQLENIDSISDPDVQDTGNAPRETMILGRLYEFIGRIQQY